MYNPLKTRQKTKQQFCNDLQVDVNQNFFENLKKVCSNAKLKYTKQKVDERGSMDLNTFLNLKCKSSKVFRKIMNPKKVKIFPTT